MVRFEAELSGEVELEVVQPWICTAEVLRCWEPGAPRASPWSSLQRCPVWVGWQRLSFLHIWNKKVRETEVLS